MDICLFFGTNTASVGSSSSSKDIESYSSSSDSELESNHGIGDSEAGPPKKKTCRPKSKPLTSKRRYSLYSKNWEKEFSRLMYDEDIDGAFCQVCKQSTAESNTHHTGGVWVTKPFRNWKKLLRK